MKQESEFWKTDPGYLSVLQSRYNILDIIEFKTFDIDFKNMPDRLRPQIKKDYHTQDRFIIVHFDTDFYWHGHGINLNNMFEVWRNLDIPLFTMIVYTNHIGISKEIDELCKHQHAKDRPMVIETFLNPGNYLDHYPDDTVDLDRIDYHALCLMAGSPRSHRYGVYNHLRHITQDKLVMTLKGSSCT